ncbi:unnamed protein product, partial [Pseudo-nitzschia multistriata]
SQNRQRIGGLSARKNHRSEEKSERFYELISVEDADKMLMQERLLHNRELRKLKDMVEIQRKQIYELDSRAQLPGVDDGFVDDDDSIRGNTIENDPIDDLNDGDFFHSSSTTIDEEEYKHHHQNAHSAAQRRTLEIELRQVEEENEELENEFKTQRQSHETDIEEFRRTIYDLRDRSDCIQQELKLEFTYFERAKVELEDVLSEEQAKTRELEQRLLLARREQEILEEASIEAQRQQEEIQNREEQERHQRILELEQEERHRAHLQREREEQLRREHQELEELDQNQAEFDKAYYDFLNANNAGRGTEDHHFSNQQQNQVVGGDGSGKRPQEYQYSVGTTQAQPSQSAQYTPYDTGHRQAADTFVGAQATGPPRAKRTGRKNADAHARDFEPTHFEYVIYSLNL